MFSNNLPDIESLQDNALPDFESQKQRERELIEDLMERNRQQDQNNDWIQPSPNSITQYNINNWNRKP